jgi:hypothetical protein
VAAFGLAGSLVVSGCVPSSWHLGSAMLYKHQTVVKTKPYRLSGFSQVRVSNTTLAAEAANLSAAYNKYPNKTQLNYTAADIPRNVLSWILRFAAENQLAARRGITVTSAAAQQALNTVKSNLKSSGVTIDDAAVASGLPPDMLPQLGNWIAIGDVVANQLDNGKPPTSTAAGNKLTARADRLLCLTAKSMDIKVNPQYGVFDYTPKTLAVVAKPATLSEPSPAPSPAKIQTTPKC